MADKKTKKVADGWVLVKTKEKVSKHPSIKKKHKSYMPKHPVKATPSQKRTEANKKNGEKSRFAMRGIKASNKSPVKRDLPNELIDSRITSLLTREFIGRVISQYTLSTMGEVTKAANNPRLSMIERIVCKIILKAHKNEDIFRLEFLLQRSIGKVTDKLLIEEPDRFAHLSTEQLKEQHAKLSKRNLEVIRKIEKKEIEAKTIELDLGDYKYNEVDGEDTEGLVIEDQEPTKHN